MSDAILIGDEGDGLTAWARKIVANRIQSYTRLKFFPVTNGTVTLSGTTHRRLILGERPLKAVTAVSLDGAALPAADYRWTRAGSLWRDQGWGDESRQVVVVGSWGFSGPPPDIMSVLSTATARLVANPGQWKSVTEATSSGGENGSSTTTTEVAAVADGFSLSELAVLNRYRRRTG